MKTRTVLFSVEAEQDFLSILEWLTPVAGGNVALSYVLRIRQHCLGFDMAGERGMLRNDILPNLRFSGLKNASQWHLLFQMKK